MIALKLFDFLEGEYGVSSEDAIDYLREDYEISEVISLMSDRDALIDELAVKGSSKNDLIIGDKADTVIRARRGHDLVFGPHGNDRLFGGPPATTEIPWAAAALRVGHQDWHQLSCSPAIESPPRSQDFPAQPQSFFCRPAEVVGPELIGCRLVKRQPDDSLLWGVIVETEAYVKRHPLLVPDQFSLSPDSVFPGRPR